MKVSFKKLLMLFNKREKNKLIFIFLMMIVAAIFETMSIGIIIPFVGVLTKPDIIHEQSILFYVYDLFNFDSTKSYIVFSVGILILVFVLKNLYLLLFNYVQFRVILNQQVKLSSRLFKEYLTKPYTFHLQRNTAELLRNVNLEVFNVFQGIIIPGFQLFTELLITVSILSLLFVTEPLATVVASIILSGSIFLFFKVFKQKIIYLGKEQQLVNSEMIKWVNQGLGACKEVKVSGKESFFIKAFTKQSSIKAKNNRYMKMLDQAPRLFIETLLVGTVLVTMLIIVLQGSGTEHLIASMALFAMAAFRLMPSITRIMALATQIRYNQPALKVVYEDLFENRDESTALIASNSIVINQGKRKFNDSIKLTNVSFRYPNSEIYAINDVSLTIPIGQSVAIIGESGAGKTTVIDIILGLLNPEKGKLLVDGINVHDQINTWQQKIGYIPQSIFLSDDTIRSNVAFGIEHNRINDEEVWRALDQAHLREFIKSLPEQLDTMVGERGVRLSGGQRQRIGIARALYHNPEILFMDEATSALDNETEKEIMKAIDGLKGEKTLIIIAHRLSTIENCNIIFKINKGRLIAIENKAKQSAI